MKHTIRQVFRSGKFVVGFSIFVAILLIVIVYPLISAVTLIITVMVLSANFLIEILYGFIDPRIKAAQAD